MMLFDLCCIPEIYQRLVTEKMFLSELVRTRRTCKSMDRLVEKNRYSYRQKTNFELFLCFTDLGNKTNGEMYFYVRVAKNVNVYPLEKHFYFLDPFNELSAINFKKIELWQPNSRPIDECCTIASLDSFLKLMKFRTEIFELRTSDHFTYFISKIYFTCLVVGRVFDLYDFDLIQNTKIVRLYCYQDFIPDLYGYLGQLEYLDIGLWIQIISDLKTFRQGVELFVSALIMDDERKLKTFLFNTPKFDFWTEEFKKEKRFVQLYYGERCHTYVSLGFQVDTRVYNVGLKLEINCVDLKNGEILLLLGKEHGVNRIRHHEKFYLFVVKNREELLMEINHARGLFGGQMPFDLSYLVERGFLEASWEEAATLFQEIAHSFVSISNADVQRQ